MNHKPNEDWYIPRDSDPRNLDEQPQLLVRFQFRYSNLAMYEDLRYDYEQYLREDFETLAAIQ